MSKELLKALTDVLDDLKLRKNLNDDDTLNISDSVLVKAEKAVESHLAQPEQGFVTPRQGLEEYKRGYARAELDLKREPLSSIKILELTSKHEYAINLIRAVEKAHGIGVDNE